MLLLPPLPAIQTPPRANVSPFPASTCSPPPSSSPSPSSAGTLGSGLSTSPHPTQNPLSAAEMEPPVPALLPDNKPEALGAPPENGRELMEGGRSESSVGALPPIGPGLLNLGNTCFLNAVLQCVMHTVPLVQSLRASAHESPCSECRGGVIGLKGRFCSLCALRQHLETCFYAMGGVVEPHGFVNNLPNVSSSFSRFQQEDAHEFLSYLLDCLHTSCLDPQSRDGPSSLRQDSFIKQIFGGRLQSQVKCCDCGHVSNTFEPLLDLSLEIEDSDTLEEALASFTKVEKIEDPEIKFACDGCNALVSVQKQFTLDQAPPIVALHFKRFKSYGYFANKIDKFVKYPLNLEFKPFLSATNDVDSLIYELYAVLVHDGRSSSFGHYYCFIRSSPDAWYMMDDDVVVRRNEQQALDQRAYILFYMKQGTPWFSSLMKEQWTTNIINKASHLCVPGHMEKLQNPYFEGERNFKSRMETMNTDESLNLSGGVCLSAHSNQAATMSCDNLLITPRIHENMATSGNTNVDAHMNDAEGDLVSGTLEASKDDVSVTYGKQSDITIDSQKAAPCSPSPNRLSTNKFYNETWEEDEKESLPELHPSGGEGNHATKVDEREQAAQSHLKSMPSSRRNSFDQVVCPVSQSANAARRRRKRKKHVDQQTVPCHASMPRLQGDGGQPIAAAEEGGAVAKIAGSWTSEPSILPQVDRQPARLCLGSSYLLLFLCIFLFFLLLL